MGEQDVFERRLRAALLRHVAGGPTEFDALGFARTVAAKEPRSHGLATALGWRLARVPHLAWVLLLMAALLAATIGGALFVGSKTPQPLPAVLPPIGQTFACPAGSTPDRPGPVDQARPPQDSNAAIAFDRRAGRLIALTSPSGAPETWSFDVCTNTWTEQQPDQQPVGVDDWDLFVYDVDSDLTIAVDRQDGTVWAYELQADTWTPVQLANEPRAGVLAGAVAYDASVDRIVVYTGELRDAAETWLLDLRTGTWSKSVAETPRVVGWLVAPTMAYDDAAGRTVVFLRAPTTAYDATADSWEVLADTEPTWPYPGRMVYDPVNRRLVGLGQTSGTPDIEIPPGGVEALDLVKGERTVLLERAGE